MEFIINVASCKDMKSFKNIKKKRLSAMAPSPQNDLSSINDFDQAKIPFSCKEQTKTMLCAVKLMSVNYGGCRGRGWLGGHTA